MRAFSTGKIQMRERSDEEITRQAVEAFATLYSERTGLPSRIHLWPGGDERTHNADALVILGQNPGGLRVLVDATICLEGPIERYGSGPFRLESVWHGLERTIASKVPTDCSFTIYWREAANEMLGRPATDVGRKRFVRTLPATLAAIVSEKLRPAKSGIFINDELPEPLQPFVSGIAIVTNVAGKVTFRYPLKMTDGTKVYSDVPLNTVGIGPDDLNDAIMNKLEALQRYRQKAGVHKADQVWLLVVADGRSAASILSPISFANALPDGIAALGVKPNFDAVFLVARGNWSRRTDPLGFTDEWLLASLLPNPQSEGGNT